MNLEARPVPPRSPILVKEIQPWRDGDRLGVSRIRETGFLRGLLFAKRFPLFAVYRLASKIEMPSRGSVVGHTSRSSFSLLPLGSIGVIESFTFQHFFRYCLYSPDTSPAALETHLPSD